MGTNPRLELYLAKILNPAQRAYAHAYARWLKHGQSGQAPPGEHLPWTAQQSIRSNVLAYSTPGPLEGEYPSPKGKQKKINSGEPARVAGSEKGE